MKFFVFVGSFAQILPITNITTTPLLTDNEIATGYFGLKLMIRIEAADLYESCRWLKDESTIRTIFNKFISCSYDNVETESHHFSCVEENQVIAATVTFVSALDKADSGNYRVQCRNASLTEFIIAQLNIMVMGKSSCCKFKVLSTASGKAIEGTKISQ